MNIDKRYTSPSHVYGGLDGIRRSDKEGGGLQEEGRGKGEGKDLIGWVRGGIESRTSL